MRLMAVGELCIIVLLFVYFYYNLVKLIINIVVKNNKQADGQPTLTIQFTIWVNGLGRNDVTIFDSGLHRTTMGSF